MKKNIILIIYIRGKNNKFIQTIFSIILFFLLNRFSKINK